MDKKLLTGIILLFAAMVFLVYVTVEETKNNTAEKTEAKKQILEKNIFVLVLDGTGASYFSFYENLQAKTVNGEELQKAKAENLEELSKKGVAFLNHKTVIPSTTESHSTIYIAGDCGNKENAQNCVGDTGITSLCDLAREHKAYCIMISAYGDFSEARKEFDVVLHEEDSGEIKAELNRIDETTIEINNFFSQKAKERKPLQHVFESPAEKYSEWNNFFIESDKELLELLNEKFSSKKFLVFSNLGGMDKCGHETNEENYAVCIEETDKKMGELLDFFYYSNNWVFALTADHGMAFDCAKECKGHHSTPPYSNSDEALFVPFLVFDGKKTGNVQRESNSFDLIPTVFGFAGIKNSCSEMRYCKGKDLSIEAS